MLEIIIVILILVAVGWGLPRLEIEPKIKNLIVGIVVVFAVLFIVLTLLDAFGVMNNPLSFHAHPKAG